MTIAIYTADILTHSKDVADTYICDGLGHTGQKSDAVRFSITQYEGVTMKYTDQLHDAKTAFMAGTGAYASVAQAIIAEYGTDTDSIESEVLAVLNTDYDVVDCRDNKPLTTALNSMQKAFRTAGDTFADGKNGKLVFKFSTTGGKSDKSRTIAVTHVTLEQVALAEAREKEDERISRERQEEDEKIENEKRRMEIAGLSPLDVFLRVAKDVSETYPDHDMREILAAGMAWLDNAEDDIHSATGATDTEQAA